MSSADPSFHRRAEQRFIEHVEQLLNDERIHIDTTRGRKPLGSRNRRITRDDDAVELKRLMSEMGKPDRQLQARMPIGAAIEVELRTKRLFLFPITIGRLRAVCISPARALVNGDAGHPLSRETVQRLARESSTTAPTTLVLMSTSGFANDARQWAKNAPNVVLVEPREDGGFDVAGSANVQAELFNPEAENEKRQRVREAITAAQFELSGTGIAADRIAAKTQLPAQLVESELKSYAKEHPGLAARRLDGRVVLYREASAASLPAGGTSMPMIDRIRALFARRGETEKKIAFLAERRAALGQQRDRAYEELASLETKDGELREQFKNAAAELAKRRITGQLLQVRKDMERRQQLLGVLNQQINVVSTHLHNLELVQQGQTAKLPDSDEMATDAAAAEEMLATLQESAEMANSVGSVAASGMSAEEQALYDELLRETGAPAETVKEPARGESIAGATQTPAGQRLTPPIMPTPEREKERRQRNEPEAG